MHAATGSTDKQIAELMHLSVRTVENRLHRVYQKLGLSHRRELADALTGSPRDLNCSASQAGCARLVEERLPRHGEDRLVVTLTPQIEELQ